MRIFAYYPLNGKTIAPQVVQVLALIGKTIIAIIYTPVKVVFIIFCSKNLYFKSGQGK